MLVLVGLLVAAIGVGVLLSQLGNQGGSNPALGATARTPARAGGSETSAPPTTSSSPSPTTSSTPSSTAASSTAPAVDPDADKRLEQFVKSYFDDVTKDTDRTWNQLAPSMREAAGGREGYDGFWETIDKVKVNQIRADASAQTADVNLTFRRKDHTERTETHRLTFVPDGEAYLIESDQNLS